MNINQRAEKSVPKKEKVDAASLRTELLDEFPVLPEKFFTFTHEGISEIWMQETVERPIRGVRQKQNNS